MNDTVNTETLTAALKLYYDSDDRLSDIMRLVGMVEGLGPGQKFVHANDLDQNYVGARVRLITNNTFRPEQVSHAGAFGKLRAISSKELSDDIGTSIICINDMLIRVYGRDLILVEKMPNQKG